MEYHGYTITRDPDEHAPWWTIAKGNLNCGGAGDLEIARQQIDRCRSGLRTELGARYKATPELFADQPPDQPLFGHLVCHHKDLWIEWAKYQKFVTVLYAPKEGKSQQQALREARALLAQMQRK